MDTSFFMSEQDLKDEPTQVEQYEVQVDVISFIDSQFVRGEIIDLDDLPDDCDTDRLIAEGSIKSLSGFSEPDPFFDATIPDMIAEKLEDLQTREREAQETEEFNASRATELDGIATELNEKSKALDELEKSLNERESELNERERALNSAPVVDDQPAPTQPPKSGKGS